MEELIVAEEGKGEGLRWREEGGGNAQVGGGCRTDVKQNPSPVLVLQHTVDRLNRKQVNLFKSVVLEKKWVQVQEMRLKL